MSDKYRLDGSPYPPGDEGLFEWAKDMEDTRGRIVQQETLWNGLWISTVWLGLDHNFMRSGPPLIFETMAFNHIGADDDRYRDCFMDRYSTLYQAEVGHLAAKRELSSIGYTLRWWWSEIWSYVNEQ